MDSPKVFVLDTRNAVGVALSVLVAFISGPGGQGGGSFYIPLFTALLGFSVNQAAALSSAVVLFGCISMVIQAAFTPHPQSPRLPVIDYTLVLALTPCLMLGLALGVLLNAVVSQWLLNLIVVSVWSWSCVQLSVTYRKARARERQHKLAQKEAKQAPDVATSVAPLAVVMTAQAGKEATAGADKQPKQVAQGPESPMTLTGVAAVCRHASHSIRSWSSRQPWGCIATIAGLFTFFIASQVVRGSLLAQCSAGWWAVLGAVCGVSLSAGVLVSVWLLRQQAQHTVLSKPSPATLPLGSNSTATEASLPQLCEASATPGSIACTASSAATCVSCAPVHLPAPAAASVYGEVGILGSVVQWTPTVLAKLHTQMLTAGLLLAVWPLSPIIMAIKGMHPQVAAATSKLMLFMITMGAGLSFISSSSVSLSYVLVYGLTNFVATPVGVWIADKIIKRTGQASMLLMLTIVRLALCVVVQTVFAVVPSLIALARGLPEAGFMANWPKECN